MSQCRSSKVGGRKNFVHDVTVAEESPESFSNIFIGEVQIGQINDTGKAGWFTSLKVNNQNIQFKLDTGAEANVMPLAYFEKLNRRPKLKPTKTVLSAYGGHKIKTTGKAVLKCQNLDIEFYIADVKSPPILGLQTCQELRLVERTDLATDIHVLKKEQSLTRSKLVDDYRDVFQGLGKFGGQYHIELDPSVQPVVHPPRKVPFSLQSKLQETLLKLEADGVIAAVDKPTEWVNSIVLVEKKNGSLRICLDPRDLNTAIKREHYRIPTPEDISAELHDKKIFTILDEKDGYWQVELDEPSSYLCTFNTTFGRYRFKRMPFGISSASEVFQKKNQEVFGDIRGVQMIADDMIIAAKDSTEHDRIIVKVMERARERNIKFNPSKIQFRVDSVKYMGNVITQEGLKPDNDKIEAIVNMPTPQDKPALQRLLGMVNYLSKYIPNMSGITSPLRDLLKKDVAWTWDKTHDHALEVIKDVLTAKPVLNFFDSTKPVTIQADASQNGLGACLIQEGRPIAYASRALTAAESNYAQIEKELLAIVFSCEKFHQYVYGKPVEVQSDHKPLETITKKPLSRASPRLQRMLLRLQRYQINTSYVPGKYMYIADTLSRAYLPTTGDASELNKEMEVMVHGLVTSLSVSPSKLDQLVTATVGDCELQELASTLRKGWPEVKYKSPISVRSYWTMRDEIHEAEGLLFCGEKLIIPRQLRREMLATLHEGHLGMEKCKSRARASIYWPNMTSDIEDFISKCSTCNKYKPKQQKEPLTPHKVPDRPWQKLGMDLFQYGTTDYLVVIDYFSKYPEICRLENKTASNVIIHLKSVLARHGIPEVIMSDNMPFASREFKEFAKKWDIELVTSSPTYPQSNGLSERMVQTIKNFLRKSEEDNSDPYISLLEYRNTPLAGTDYSPAELLMSRKLRSRIPTDRSALAPKVADNAYDQLVFRQDRQKYQYDKQAKSLPQLKPGDSVRIRVGKTWEPAQVRQRHSEPRSFIVQTPNGREYRRNRRHLLKTEELPPTIIGPDLEEPKITNSNTPSQAAVLKPQGTQVKQPVSTIPKTVLTPSSNCARTSSGRVVKPPSWLKDYAQ